MLELVIAGLLSASLGSRNIFESESSSVTLKRPDLARLELAAPVIEFPGLRLRPALPEGGASDLARPRTLGAKLNDVACILSNPRGVRLTPTDRAPRAPSLFFTVTLGTCPTQGARS
jgi:hypothetical protein